MMNEKSLVGKELNFNGKRIKIHAHDQTGVTYSFAGDKKKSTMSWDQLKKGADMGESKAKQLLDLLEKDAPVAPAAPRIVDSYEMKFTYMDKPAIAYFNVMSRGTPNRTTYQHYEPGDAPELEFDVAYYEDQDEPLNLQPEFVQKLTDEAIEKYAEDQEDYDSSDDDYDRYNDR